MMDWLTDLEEWDPFPSPCGEKVGINVSKALATATVVLSVSVPLRGKGRDQPYPRKSLNS
jgi:hypothetical protein